MIWIIGFVFTAIWVVFATGRFIENLKKTAGPIKAWTFGMLLGVVIIATTVEIVSSVVHA